MEVQQVKALRRRRCTVPAQQIVPRPLAHAMEQHRAAEPNDDVIIERLFEYLRRSKPTIDEIRVSICEFYHIEPSELVGLSREKETSLARQIFYYLVFRLTHLSMTQIGKRIDRDHSTVSHGVRQITKYVLTRPLVRDDIDLLRLRICEKMLRRPVRVTPC